MSNSSNNNYYEQDDQSSIERAILAEDLAFSTIDNVQGKFFLPVMTPNIDTSSGPVYNSNGKNDTSNYIKLTIPGYMLFQFMKPVISNNSIIIPSVPCTIPKGTVFLVEFLGGEFTIQRTCIVGLLTTDL